MNHQTHQDVFNLSNSANLPEEKKKHMMDRVTEIKDRMVVLAKTDDKLAFIDDFNKRLAIFGTSLVDLEGWLTEARKRVDVIISPTAEFSPEDRVTKTMEFQEDLKRKMDFMAKQEAEKQSIFPKPDEGKVSSDAKKFMAKLQKIQDTMNELDNEVS